MTAERRRSRAVQARAATRALRTLRRDIERGRSKLDDIRRREASNDAPEVLREVGAIADDLVNTIDRFLQDEDTRAMPSVRRTPVRVGEVLHRSARIHDPEGDRITLDVPSLVMRLDAARLERIVDVLIEDAVRDERARLIIGVGLMDRGVMITFDQTSGGAPPEIQANDDPLSTGWSDERVQTAAALVEEQGGHLDVQDDAPSVIRLWLPGADQ